MDTTARATSPTSAQWLLDVPGLPSPVRVSARPHSIAVTLAGVPIYVFDPMGRLYEAFVDGRNYLRGLDDRVMEKWGRSTIGVPVRRRISPQEAHALYVGAYTAMGKVQDALASGRARVVEREPEDAPQADALAALETVCEWDAERLHADGSRFLSIYKPVSILPPDQYMALVLQATEGCSHNKCTFCSFYRDRPFRIKPLLEFKRHVAQVKEFMGPAVRMRRTLFLADANAIVIPERLLVPMLRHVNASFHVMPLQGRGLGPAGENFARYKRAHPEAVEGVYAFVDAFTSRYKTVEDFSELARLNLRRVYIGLETGHDPLLAWLRKAGTAQDAVDAVRRIKRGGVSVGVIVMIGVGGRRFADAHVADTAHAINQMSLGAGDFVYFSEFISSEASEYTEIAAREGVAPLTHQESMAQMAAIRSRLAFDSPPPTVSVYDIREFVY